MLAIIVNDATFNNEKNPYRTINYKSPKHKNIQLRKPSLALVCLKIVCESPGVRIHGNSDQIKLLSA